MGIYFANGRSQLPNNSWTITVNNTGGTLTANSYYFSLQARNRVGLTLPIYSSLITVANNNTITFTINSTAKETGEEWISYVISANTINQGISYCQIAEIPLINLNDNSSYSFPLTLTLDKQEQLALNNVIANNTLFPTTTALHGMCRGLTSTGLIYKYNLFDTTTPQDSLYTFNGISGKWKATGRFTTYIASVTDEDGCSQDIRDITDPSNIIVPKYNPTGTTSNSIVLWLTSTKVVSKGTRISVVVKLGELNKSQLFDGLLELKFKGFVNTNTGIKRTTVTGAITPLDEIDVLYKYDANNPTLILEDDLEVGEAYALEVSCNFQSAEIEDYIINGSYISITPEFTSSASIYNPAGIILGDVIFKANDKRRIVPNLGLTAIALKGSGLVKNFSFPVQEETIVTALQPNSSNIIAINKLGNVYTTTSLPSDAVQRAIVKTISGESNPSIWSSNVSVSASGSLSITVNYPCSTDGYGTIRSTYPDVIANNTKGLFNPAFINLYIDNGTVIKKLSSNAVVPGSNQVFTITDISTGTTATLPSNSDNTFSLFAPGTVSISASTGGSLAAGSYRVAYSFSYDGNQITSISHSSSVGCVLELSYDFIEALQNFKYTWLNGSGVPSNSLGNDDNYYIDNVSRYYYQKISGVWTYIGSFLGTVWLNGSGVPSNTLGVDGYYYMDNNSKTYYQKASGVWAAVGSLSGSVWFNGTSDPTAGIGFVGDYYLNTTTYNIFNKTTSTTWVTVGLIKGTTWYTSTGIPTSALNAPTTINYNVGDYWLNSNTGLYYQKTALPNTWSASIGNLRGATWLNGTGVPASGTGSTDDMYLNNTNGDYYVKTNSTTWTLTGNLRASTGGWLLTNTTTAPTKTASQLGLYSKSGVLTALDNAGAENVIAYLDKNQSYTRAQGTSITNLADGATISVDLNLGNVYKVTLSGNRTLANPTTVVNGFIYHFLIYQDGVGSRTLTFGTNYKFVATPVLSTGANKLDVVKCIADGTNLICSIEKGWF